MKDKKQKSLLQNYFSFVYCLLSKIFETILINF